MKDGLNYEWRGDEGTETGVMTLTLAGQEIKLPLNSFQTAHKLARLLEEDRIAFANRSVQQFKDNVKKSMEGL
jgi:hypothetical protein